MSLLLCFSGQIGSGKSSVSTAVAAALGWRRTGFGDFLRSELARLGGNPNDRKALQELGQKRVENDPTAFCYDVLAAAGFEPGVNFIIDGVRHVGIFDALAILGLPSSARLLYLRASEAARIARVTERQDAQDFERASKHGVEGDLGDGLPRRADAIVDADQSLDGVVLDCLSLVRRWRSLEGNQLPKDV